MMMLVRDTRFGLRLLRRNPGFTLVAVVTLALGIAATTSIFSVVYGLFFAPLPYHNPDRLVMVWEYQHGHRAGVSTKSFLAWKREATAFTDINAWGGRSVNLATADRPENVAAGLATPEFLSMLGYGHPLALGRTFHEDEGTAGRDRVLVLTYRLWKDRFAGDPAIVGRQVLVDDVPHTVIGVLGEGPADHQQSKVWLPLVLTEEQQSTDTWLLAMARLKDGVTVQQANQSMAVLAARLERELSRGQGWTVSVEPFRNNFVGDSTKRGIWLLLAAVLVVLLIACANVANLLLARGTTRHRELAVRVAIGATPSSIVRQLLVESLVLSLAGGVMGTLLAMSTVDLIVALMPPFTLPSETEITMSIPVLLFAVAACTFAGVAAGLAPAWQAWRTSAAEAMKAGGRTVDDQRFGLRRALVAIEFALALTLLSGGGMAVHALLRSMTVDPGFAADQLTTFSLPIPRGRLATAEQARAFYDALTERIAAVPGVASLSVSTGMPVRGASFGRQFEIVGQPVTAPHARPWTRVNIATPSYHSTFGIPIRRGRPFAESDRAGSRRVAIINEAFAARYLAGRDPVGQRVLMSSFGFEQPESDASQPIEWEIVGVQGDAANQGPGRPALAEVAVPFAQNPWPSTIVAIRTTPGHTVPQVEIADILRTLDPTLPMANVQTIEQTLSESTAADRFYTVFLSAFAALALVLATVGIFGVMAFVVGQRTHEIGLRIALGGDKARVLTEVLREGMTTALVGTAFGAIGARFIGRVLEGTVYGVEPNDPVTLALVVATLLLAALVACIVPARRAASVDPMVALRQD